MSNTRHRSLAAPLAWAYVGLIVYASLSPFTGWTVPVGLPYAGLGHVPWPSGGHTAFDVQANLWGYLPLGALVFGALVRSKRPLWWAALAALLSGSLLSWGMENLQNYLPQRVPSSLDWALNTLGTLCGVLVGWVLYRLHGEQHWQVIRDRWFIERSAGGLALLVLWPVGLLFPMPVPLGMGQVLLEAQAFVKQLLRETPWSAWADGLFNAKEAFIPLSYGAEWVTILLGLLAPCWVAFCVVHAGWRRAVFVFFAGGLGLGITTLSTALSFGPEHALAWLTPAVLPAMGVSVLLALMMADVPRRGAAAMGLMGLTALVFLVAQAPTDPYYAQSLSSWEQGKFIRFHGVSQWVSWFWPYVAMCYFFSVIVSEPV